MSATCADLVREFEEPLAGTGPRATGWVLIEQPGPWGRDALRGSRLDPEVGARLAAATADLAVKVLLVRRPGGRLTGASAGAAERQVLLAHAGARPWVERLDVGDERELSDLDPALSLAASAPGIGSPQHEPLLLVCTHAKRDRCCATLGRPIADTLGALHPELTWESSHLGGHRFAGNLLVLPDGLAYGGLDVAGALEVVTGHLAGRVDAARLRGRSSLDRSEQAAEALLRRRLGLVHDTDVRIIRSTALDGDRGGHDTEVVARAEGRTLLLHLRWRPTGEDRLLSCDAERPEDPGAFELLSVRDADA